MATNSITTGLNNRFNSSVSSTNMSMVVSPHLNSPFHVTEDTAVFQRKPKLPTEEEIFNQWLHTPLGKSLKSAYSLLHKLSSVLGHPLLGLTTTVRYVASIIYQRAPFLKGWIEKNFSELPQEKYKIYANHEMGHALAGATANLEMEGLFLHKIGHMGGGVAHTPSVSAEAEKSPEGVLKRLVMVLGGHAAELNRSTAQELNNQKHISRLRFSAYQDFINAAKLLKSEVIRRVPGIKLKSEDIPDLNPAWLTNLNKEIATCSVEGKLPENKQATIQHKIAQGDNAISKFLDLPIVKDALQTAGAIHGVLSEEKREQLIEEVAEKKFLDKPELYDVINRHVSESDGQKMVQHLQAFLKRVLRP